MKGAEITHSKVIISSKGQVVIPRKFRELLGIHAGLELLLKVRKDGVIEMKPSERSIDMFFGRCKREKEATMSIADMDEAIESAVIENERKND